MDAGGVQEWPDKARGATCAAPNGLVIVDVTDVQFRRPNPQIRVISTLFWEGRDIDCFQADRARRISIYANPGCEANPTYSSPH